LVSKPSSGIAAQIITRVNGHLLANHVEKVVVEHDPEMQAFFEVVGVK
jgi:hypothetical protein